MNEQFRKAVTAVKTLNTKAGTLYTSLVLFAVSVMPEESRTGGQVVDLKPKFKVEETLANAEFKVEMGKNSTYRVVKNLLVNCAAKGIALVDPNGKIKGKTALEDELAGTKVPKAEIDKFKVAMNTASAIGDRLSAHDRIMAAALVQDLLKKVTTGIALAA